MKAKSTIRYKIVNRKRVSLCDRDGNCQNLAYREVYPSQMGGEYKDRGWSYLCRKHFEQEQRSFKGRLANSRIG